MSNFTRSCDGIMRANFRATVRLDREAIEKVDEIANAEGVSIRKWLDDCLRNGITWATERYTADQEATNGQ